MSYSDRRQQLQEAVKPILRGYSHAVTTPLALAATVVLAVMAAGRIIGESLDAKKHRELIERTIEEAEIRA